MPIIMAASGHRSHCIVSNTKRALLRRNSMVPMQSPACRSSDLMPPDSHSMFAVFTGGSGDRWIPPVCPVPGLGWIRLWFSRSSTPRMAAPPPDSCPASRRGGQAQANGTRPLSPRRHPGSNQGLGGSARRQASVGLSFSMNRLMQNEQAQMPLAYVRIVRLRIGSCVVPAPATG